MRVLDGTSARRGDASPEWVADWWIPEPEKRQANPDVDLVALQAPEPVITIEVSGRPTLPAAASQ